jgi:hypothetical protein
MELAGIVVVAAIAGCGWLIWRSWRLQRLQQSLEAYPIVSIRQAGEGPLAVEGRALALETMVAPFSAKTVIGFRVKVEQARSDGEGTTWETLVDLSELQDFEVEDGTGRALVRAVDYELLLDREERQTNGILTSVPDAVEAFLRHHGETSHGWIFNKSLRWAEYLLEPGEAVFVTGRGRRELDPRQEVDNLRQAPTRLVVDPPSDGPIVVADRLREELLRGLSLGDLPPGLKGRLR